MSSKDDLELAKALQAEYDRETAQKLEADDDVLFDPTTFCTSPVGNKALHVSGNESMSIVDDRWELLDPNPDARAMFLEFNERYFWGKLAGVEVRWSPRMTLCAGVCCYEGRGGLCSVRLSKPLLSLRPRKDLVQTLLHEMIHAYLFVTDNNKDHDGHGPEFCKHMKRLNSNTGSNITIYHTFHDEVDAFRQHWWKCNGPCQKKKPYFGLVKRAMNRAPSFRDTWWAEHQRNCGGTYTKIKEPEGYGEKKKGGSKRKKEDGAGSADEKGAKRQATSNSNSTSSTFTGKGNVLGAGTSSKPTLLQTWIAEQQKKQNGSSTSSSTSTTKPPSSLGAPPAKPKPPSSLGAPPTSPSSKFSSGRPISSSSGAPTLPKQHTSPNASTKSGGESKPAETPLKRWISENTGAIRKVVSKSGGRNNKKRKHTRKISGKRKELLAIFDSDSDSDDELFKKKPRLRRTPIAAPAPSASTSGSQHPNGSFANRFPGGPQMPNYIKDMASATAGINNLLNPGSSRLPTAKPLFGKSPLYSEYGRQDVLKPLSDNSNTSTRVPTSTRPSTSTAADIHIQRPKVTSPVERPKVTSPYNPYLSNRVTGGFDGTHQRSNTNTGLYGGVPSHGIPGTHGTMQNSSNSATGSSHGIPGTHGTMQNSSNSATGVTGPPHGIPRTHGTMQNVPGSATGLAVPPVKTVQCPACTMSVPEMDINAHLDMCLS